MHVKTRRLAASLGYVTEGVIFLNFHTDSTATHSFVPLIPTYRLPLVWLLGTHWFPTTDLLLAGWPIPWCISAYGDCEVKSCVVELTFCNGFSCMKNVRNVSRRNENKSVGETYYLLISRRCWQTCTSCTSYWNIRNVYCCTETFWHTTVRTRGSISVSYTWPKEISYGSVA
jgi:hypothetical protein